MNEDKRLNDTAANEAVTIVIPNWNGKKWLRNCLDSLRTQTVPAKIIIVDNGSEDGSVELLKAEYPETVVREFGENTGFCRAVNEGIRESTTPYVILLNNDIVCDKCFTEKLLETIKRHPNCFSVSARMMQLRAPEKIDDAGDYYCALGWAFADGKGQSASARAKERKIFSACAGAAIYRREVFDRIGLFDVQHFAYLEDIDIGYRARLAGYENRYAPDAVVFHAGSAASGSTYNAFKTCHTSRNSIYLIRKNMPVWQIILNLPLLAAGFLIKTVFFIRKGLGRQYVKGLAEGFRMKLPTEQELGVAANAKPAGGRPARPFMNCLKIQLELWVNTIRRFS